MRQNPKKGAIEGVRQEQGGLERERVYGEKRVETRGKRPRGRPVLCLTMEALCSLKGAGTSVQTRRSGTTESFPGK